MRIPTHALPLVGAVCGLLLASGVGLTSAGLFVLAGASLHTALDHLAWSACSGAAAGFVLGVWGAFDSWWTDIPEEAWSSQEETRQLARPTNEAATANGKPVPRGSEKPRLEAMKPLPRRNNAGGWSVWRVRRS